MTEKLTSARIKIERAKQHLNELQGVIRAYHASNPYEVIPEDYVKEEAGTRITVRGMTSGTSAGPIEESTDPRIAYRLRIRTPPPSHIGAIVGDLLHNLRSALDYLACDLVCHLGKTPTRETAFPIAKKPKELESLIGGKIQGATQPIKRMLKRLKPYKGANNPFWPIHKLNIIDKHRLLLTATTHSGVVYIAMRLPPFPGETEGTLSPRIGIRQKAGWFQDGDIIYVGAPKMQDNPQFPFDIAIKEKKVLGPEPVVPLLQQYIDFVERVVDIFDRHIFRTP